MINTFVRNVGLTDSNEIISTNCNALDSNGKRCPNKVFKMVQYHGESEIYDYHFEHEDFDIKWVRIGVCKKHWRENFKND